MVKLCEYYGVPVAKSWEGSMNGLSTFLTTMKGEPNIEGFVIRFHNGEMYKVKTDWYFERTRKDKQDFNFNSERNVWKMILGIV